MKTIKVALLKCREDGFGAIEIYDVNEDEFNNLVAEIYPTCEEDWWDIAKYVEEHGDLLQIIKPDFSISLRLV